MSVLWTQESTPNQSPPLDPTSYQVFAGHNWGSKPRGPAVPGQQVLKGAGTRHPASLGFDPNFYFQLRTHYGSTGHTLNACNSAQLGVRQHHVRRVPWSRFLAAVLQLYHTAVRIRLKKSG